MSQTSTQQARPRIALAMGCPAGIAPELTARLLADGELTAAADFIVFGDTRVLEAGRRAANVTPRLRVVGREEAMPSSPGEPVFVDLGNLDPKDIPVGDVSVAAGRFAIETFRRAIAACKNGVADVAVWTPFNKAAMRLAHPSYEDEIVFTAEELQFSGTASEFNILPNMWNARVTSHVPLAEVASLITTDRILRSLRLTDEAMRDSGFVRPRIAISGLNPHAGDGGNFGREEIDQIAPAVALGQADGIACSGPYSPDTVFVRANKGEFDAVLTMYHDQGQIAMKLIGFDAGVTLLGGFPFPLATPAHGSAYDIAGKGVANPNATRNAVRIATRMGTARRTRSL